MSLLSPSIVRLSRYYVESYIILKISNDPQDTFVSVPFIHSYLPYVQMSSESVFSHTKHKLEHTLQYIIYMYIINVWTITNIHTHLLSIHIKTSYSRSYNYRLTVLYFIHQICQWRNFESHGNSMPIKTFINKL